MSTRHETTPARFARPAHPRWCGVARLAIALAMIAGLGLGSGCQRRSAEAPPTPPPAPAISQVHTVGARDRRPEVELTLTADRARMSVAERLTLIITIDAAEGASAEWSPPEPAPAGQPPATLGDFTIAAATRRELPASTTETGRRVSEHTIVLEPFLEGEKRVPALSVAVRSASGGDLAITTEPLTIEVTPVVPPDEAADAALAPAREPMRPTLPAVEGDTVIAVVAGTLAAAWVGAFVWAGVTARRVRSEADPLEAARARLASMRARLEAARADAFSPAGSDPGALAADLAGAMREYLTRRWDAAAIGATAAELPGRLAQCRLPAELREPVVASLAALERWAFAPERPRTADLEAHVQTAERLLAAGAAAEAAPGTRRAPGVRGAAT